MKTILALTIFILAQSAFAIGNEAGGGGDPHAIEFISIAERTQLWLAESKLESVDASQFKQMVDELKNSLDGEITKTRLYFQDQPVLCSGIPKMGCVQNGKIVLNRKSWTQASEKEKYELTSLEIFQLMSLSKRYALAEKIGKNVESITSSTEIKLEDGTYSLIGNRQCHYEIINDETNGAIIFHISKLDRCPTPTATLFQKKLPSSYSSIKKILIDAKFYAKCQPNADNAHPCDSILYDEFGRLIIMMDDILLLESKLNVLNKKAFSFTGSTVIERNGLKLQPPLELTDMLVFKKL